MKVCDKTCIFCLFPIINKYLCMAKRSLLSRCPSYIQSVVAYFMVLYRNFLKELTKSRASAQLGEYVCGSTRGVLEFEPAVLPTAVIKILVVMHTEASERYLMVRCYDDAKDFLLLFSFPFPIDIYKPTQSARHT